MDKYGHYHIQPRQRLINSRHIAFITPGIILGVTMAIFAAVKGWLWLDCVLIGIGSCLSYIGLMSLAAWAGLIKIAEEKMCNCVEEYNKALNDQGLELDLAYFLSGRKPAIKIPLNVIDKKRRRGKPKATLIVSFCPFCGERDNAGAPAHDTPYSTATPPPSDTWRVLSLMPTQPAAWVRTRQLVRN